MTGFLFRVVTVVLCLQAGCAPADMRMHVEATRYPGFEFPWNDPRDPSCKPMLVSAGISVPAGCTAVGDVFIGDTGRSTHCQRDRVERDLREELCRLSANYGVVRRLWDSLSTCYQIRAVGYRCPSTTEASVP